MGPLGVYLLDILRSTVNDHNLELADSGNLRAAKYPDSPPLVTMLGDERGGVTLLVLHLYTVIPNPCTSECMKCIVRLVLVQYYSGSYSCN